VPVRSAAKLARALFDHYDEALLYRRLATVEREVPVGNVDEWEWRGPTPQLDELCAFIEAPNLAKRASRLAGKR
jgi:hypothetical protein